MIENKRISLGEAVDTVQTFFMTQCLGAIGHWEIIELYEDNERGIIVVKCGERCKDDTEIRRHTAWVNISTGKIDRIVSFE